MAMSQHLFIAGASVRAAAQSAVRAGCAVTAADLFCDRDLVDCGQAYHVPDFPQGILSVARQIPPAEWLYTGGLENEPQLVDAVSRRHRLLGHAGSALRQIRDPWQVSAALARSGLRFPRPERRPPPDRTGQWLTKPLRSCGGMRIRFCEPSRPTRSPTSPDGSAPVGDARQPVRGRYCQPWIRGPSYGAVFLAGRGEAVLLGVTRQLVGCLWAGADGFRYVGSIGPVAFDGPLRDEFQRIGNCLAAAFPLCGLFGIDTVLAGPDVWTIEVNPRYTASVEVLERATGLTAMEFHREACHGGPVPRGIPLTADHLHGKAVVYATGNCTVGPEFYRHLDVTAPPTGDCRLADLPPIGTSICAGQPVLTVFSRGRDVREVHRRLRTLAGKIHALLATAGAAGPLPHGPAARAR